MNSLPWGAGSCPARPSFLPAAGPAVRALSVCLVLTLLIAAPAGADFPDGLAAYDGGDYYAAYLEWLPLAEAGDGDAQAAIADLWLSELLTRPAGANERRRIRRTAAWWYNQAASCGHTVAQLNLGDLYRRGVGVERDRVQALVWLALAAKQGNAWAVENRDEVSEALTQAQRAQAVTKIESWTAGSDCRP